MGESPLLFAEKEFVQKQERQVGSMSRREEYEQKTEAILTPIVESRGFELVDVEYVKEAGTWYLRGYIDKPGGSNSECIRTHRLYP